MRSLYITEFGDMQARTIGTVTNIDQPQPIPGSEDVLIKVAYASLCGSDIHTICGQISDPKRFKIPCRLGHEMSGVIAEVGAEAAKMGFKIGDRVTANYAKYCNSCYYCRTGQENYCLNRKPSMDGMSDYVCWHMTQVHRLPANVTLLQAVMTEPLTIALGIVELAKIRIGTNVIIFGGGGVGMLCLQLAKDSGASTVTVVEPIKGKRDAALKFGADYVIDPINEDVVGFASKVTDGRGYDTVIELSGASSAAESALQVAGVNGNIVYGAMYKNEYDLPLNLATMIFAKGLHISGIFTSADLWPRAVQMLHRLQLDPMITIYEPEDVNKAVHDWVSGKIIKATLKFADIE